MKLFIGTGAPGLKAEGYLTVDIDPNNKPDIVADASGLPMVETGSVEEVYVSHVLEHIPWPYVLNALVEWARVLKPGGVIKIAVPDMTVYGEMLARKENIWHVMASIYGGHWATPGGPQGHHYGYTWDMLVEILSVLGFDDFDHWNSSFPEAANGWLYTENDERIGLSVNIVGTKKRDPILDIPTLVDRIRHRDIMQPLMVVVRELLSEGTEIKTARYPDQAHLTQLLHLKLIEEQARNRVLTEELAALRNQPATS